ncbi:putative odorant receptor 83c [Culex pipiens pallens]|nr:putative odorant receptor 83c [Culex pipiens pallens]
MEFIKRLRRYRFFQHSFTDPSEFFDSLIVVPSMVAKLTNLNVLNKDHQVFTWNLAPVVTGMLTYFYTSFDTAYAVRESTEELIFCLVTIGIGIQGAGRIFTFLIFREKLVWIHQYTKELYREECNPRTKSFLMDSVFLLSVILKVMLTCYAFTSISLVVAPLLFTIASGEKILPFGFYLPYWDRFTWFGYFSNYVLHIFMTVYVSSMDMGTDSIYMMTLMSAFTQIDLLKMSLEEMSEMVDQKHEDLENFFKKLINRHQEHLHYLRTVEIVYCFNFFITFLCLASVLIMSLFAVVKLSWYQGYVFIAFISYQLFFGCFLGTLLAMKNEQLQHEIYKISWYKLSIPHQKLLQFMLKSAQEPVCLTVIFAPLDMGTFLQVYKSIYSMFTMLLTVQEEE